jgi:nitrogen regulatory protein P-II 2
MKWKTASFLNIEIKFMKLIIGIIKPLKLDEVCTSLLSLKVQDFNVTEVKGFGRQKGLIEHYHGTEYACDFIDKTRLEITVEETQLAQVLEIIKSAANSGNVGDGKIFVYDIH